MLLHQASAQQQPTTSQVLLMLYMTSVAARWLTAFFLPTATSTPPLLLTACMS